MLSLTPPWVKVWKKNDLISRIKHSHPSKFLAFHSLQIHHYAMWQKPPQTWHLLVFVWFTCVFFIYLRPLDFLNIMSLTSELKWEEIGKLYWERILSQIWQPNEYKNQTFLSSSDVLVEDIPLSRFWICDCRPDMISISLWFSCRRLFLNSSTSITCQALFLISLSEQMQSYAVEWSWP